MKQIKKTSIIAGAIVGGVIGGTLSFVGKMSGQQILDDLGESVIDSTILTGTIAGNVASGATDFITGAVTKDANKTKEGKDDLVEAGSQMIGNVKTNVKTIIENTGEIVEGAREKDKDKLIHGMKTLAKVAIVGALTVGAVKIKPEYDEDNMAEKKEP